MLDGVIDALVLSDGRIVVANQGTYELRVFNPSGIHFDTWGGEGEGPGEFPYLRGLEAMAWRLGRRLVRAAARDLRL